MKKHGCLSMVYFKKVKNIVVKNRSGQELKKKTPFVTLTSKDMTQIVE